MNETHTYEHLRVRMEGYQSWKELPDAALELSGGRAKAKEAHAKEALSASSARLMVAPFV